MNYLEHIPYCKEYLLSTAKDLQVDEICSTILSNDEFYLWSGSSRPHQHHYGDGGLCVHTTEVVKACLENNRLFNANVSEAELFIAALYHDYGKMWDYQQVMEYDYFDLETQRVFNKPTGEWTGTDHKTDIYHIQRSAIQFNIIAANHNSFKEWYLQDAIDRITHAILAHHGQPDWGSPVKPHSKIAWLLHLCDNISARLSDNGATK
jgi:3'-5' exoribonuclease